MYKDKVSVFLPSSFISETRDLKLKTSKVGMIGRALAVFRIDNVVIYNDGHNGDYAEKDADFISEILGYMNTPQYLRKRAYPIKELLKHVGILPPLRTPHHPTDDEPKVGDYRQGFTVKRNKKGTFVDIGMENLAFCKEQLTVNKIFSFKVTKIAKEVIVTPDEPDDVYWGYNVISTNKSLKNSLKLINPDFVVSTTRYGNLINSIFDELNYKVDKSQSIAILFGGPYSSIEDNISSSKWDICELNTIPNQGTETVRTEEAVVATLSLFNLMR
ncbi:RNA-binding protein [Methanobrevibacter sp. OttesenSCG-928-K11]|nr:RNA-binding protein [Methanobrevibacter sp. OttesenSCG-928-K11]MDL2270287.1 RNA-binding protein [Methanobrevibacter sp. OttesenSCG-928-I08]